jgi:hypothetical protein
MYKNNQHRSENMKQNVLQCISGTSEAFHRVASNTRKTVNTCIPKSGGYFKELI